jgi:peptidoglycan/xylan/chitin deacetylase (PgdA/CDA1 family)
MTGGAGERRVALSFDNGPEPAVTGAVLDILAARGLAATFFVIGRKLADPAALALVARAREQGHRIGNHTFSHSVPLGLVPPGVATEEIAATQAALGALAPERLFRPFGRGGALGPHLLNCEARDLLAAGGYTCVLWNAVPRDWEDPEGWVERALAQCAAQPHSLLVLHDLPNGAMRHLAGFLARLDAAAIAITQEIPAACIAIDAGRITPACADCVAA